MVSDVIVGGELFTDYSDHPRKLTAKPKTQINRRRTLPASSWWDALPQAAWPERLLSESQDAVALQQIKEREGHLWLIVVISVSNRPLQYHLGLLPGAGYGQFEHKADSLIAKFKEAGGTVREIDVWAESPWLSPLCYLYQCPLRHGLLIITADNAITYKAQRDKKCQRTEAGERGNYWHADASAWCCCARCKIHEGVSWC